MPTISSETLHASCVAIGERAVLIEGPSGSGKSDLALRLIDRGAHLISDDYTMLLRRGNQVFANPPATIAGKMEVRGLGVLPMLHVDNLPVALMISLTSDHSRMPFERTTRSIAGVEVPVVALDSFPASAPIKVEMALKHLVTGR